MVSTRLAHQPLKLVTELVAIEERVAEIDRQQQAALAEIHELRERVRQAEADYPSILARWLANGQKGARPEPTAPGLNQQHNEAQALYDALDIARESVLTEQIQFVTKHRDRLVREADKATADAEAQALRHVDKLEAAREDIAVCREAALWARLYPSETLLIQPDRSIAGGRRQPLEQAIPGLKNPVDSGRLFELLRQDVAYLAAAATQEQKAALTGHDPRKHGDAEWADTEEARQRENERRRDALARMQSEWS